MWNFLLISNVLTISMLQIHRVYGYFSIESSIETSQPLDIIFKRNLQSDFPDDFQVRHRDIKGIASFKKVKTDEFISVEDPKAFSYDTNGNQIKFHEFKDKSQNFEFYKQQNGSGFASLIKNNDQLAKHPRNPFRMLGTIFEKGSSIAKEIVPVMAKSSRSIDGKFNYDSSLNLHSLYVHNNVDKIFKQNDFILLESERLSIAKNPKKVKRAAPNGKPVNLYVELLVVTDDSIYEQHKVFAATDNKDLVFQYMKTYFSYYVNGMNRLYEESLKTDPDMRIHIKLAGFLFATTKSEAKWADASKVGLSDKPPNFKYNDKLVVDGTLSLDAFANEMESLNLTINYDLAMGFFRKDMWVGEIVQSDDSRRSTAGLAYVGAMCGDKKYSICEEFGGFNSIKVGVHELGHNLGSLHDGASGDFASKCNASDNYLMAPSSTEASSNNFVFSQCSINKFKDVLLKNANSEISDKASCLANEPTKSLSSLFTINNSTGGLYFSADYQCKQIKGNDSYSCETDKMCETLYCTDGQGKCQGIVGAGAADGTTCASGKMCQLGKCIVDDRVPINQCPLEDLSIINKQVFPDSLPKEEMTCQETFDFFSLTTFAPTFTCGNVNFKNKCCRFCKKFEELTCVDSIQTCDNYIRLCPQANFVQLTDSNGNMFSLASACPRTCNICDTKPIKCSNSTFLCQNDGKCEDTNSSVIASISFKCTCPIGFTGFLCDTIDVCAAQNKCQNGGTCINFGNKGYTCMCPEGCSGYNCNACAKTESPKESSKYVTDSTTKFLTDSAKSTSKFLTDSAISTTKLMTESPRSTTKFMTDSAKSTTKFMTESPKSTTKFMTQSPQLTTKLMTESPRSTTKLMTASPRSTTKLKTESPRSTTKLMTESPRSTTKFITQSSKSTTKFLTDSAKSTTKFMTESPKLTTKFMTQSPKSTKCVTEKYKKQKEKPKCSPKKFVRLKNFKKRCKRVYY